MPFKDTLTYIWEAVETLKAEGRTYEEAHIWGRAISAEYCLPNTGLVDSIVMNVYRE